MKTTDLNACATPNPGVRVQPMVGASGQRFTFFMRDESIHEIEAADQESALAKLGKKLGKSRYWTLEEIETCLTRQNNEARLKRQGKIFNHSGVCGKITT